jgi:uncharacterized membrane protein
MTVSLSMLILDFINIHTVKVLTHRVRNRQISHMSHSYDCMYLSILIIYLINIHTVKVLTHTVRNRQIPHMSHSYDPTYLYLNSLLN